MDDKTILDEARKHLKLRIEAESSERQKMMDDLRFCTLDQWPSDIRKDRENDLENGPRPCLTIDKINQYIVQVVNDMRQGKPGINVRPMDDAADVETAKILKGIVRNIEDQSNADIAYSTAGESAAKIGLGYFRITTEYVSDDSFDQEIFIRPIPNTFSVYLGEHIMPDGSDAERGYVIAKVPVEQFKHDYPGKKFAGEDFSDLDPGIIEYWRTEETITIVEEFCIEKSLTRLLYLADGTTIDGKDYDQWPDSAGAKPTIMDERSSVKKQLKWAKMTGVEVLEKRDLPGKYIPIVEVIGRESHIEGKRILWGLVRPAKDSLRMYNYFASTITEKMGLAPKAPFIGAVGQFEGLEDKWKKANRVNYAYLEYNPIDVNGNALPRPERQGPTPMEAALLNQMQVIEHDVQTSLGMFKAAVGETESQQSGRAILALQRESDTGTYHFGANLGVSIRQAGKIIVDLIPHYYDTKRIIRIIGEDGEVQTAQIDPEQETAMREISGADGKIQRVFNPGVGKYDVAITVGPSYNTKRMEAAATLTEVVKSQPQLMPLIGDLLFRSLDFPYSDQIAQRLKKMLPAPLQDQNDPAAQLMQAMQKMQMMGQQMQEMNQENVQLKAKSAEGMAKVQVSQQEAQAELALQKQKQEAEAALAQAKAEAEFALKKWIAEQEASLEAMRCEHDRKMATDKMDFEMKVKSHEMLPDEVKQAYIKNRVAEEDIMPGIMQQLSQAFTQMGSLMQQSVSLQQETLQVLKAPKSVSIGGMTLGADGMPTGATVKATPVLQ